MLTIRIAFDRTNCLKCSLKSENRIIDLTEHCAFATRNNKNKRKRTSVRNANQFRLCDVSFVRVKNELMFQHVFRQRYFLFSFRFISLFSFRLFSFDLNRISIFFPEEFSLFCFNSICNNWVQDTQKTGNNKQKWWHQKQKLKEKNMKSKWKRRKNKVQWYCKLRARCYCMTFAGSKE